MSHSILIVLQLRWVTQLCLFFTDYFSLGYVQLKIFKMAGAKWGRFVMEMFNSGRKNETSYFGLLEYGISNFMGKIYSDHDFTFKCTLKYIAH